MESVGSGEPPGFADFARDRYAALARSAFLLVGDRGLAEDLLQTALSSTFQAWDRLIAIEAAESYTRTTLVRLAKRAGRRRWRGELPTPTTEMIDPIAAQPDTAAVLDLRAQLSALPFCGDLLFNGGTPFLLMGSVRGAIDVLRGVVARIPARTIVPGHGAPCDGSLITTTIGYLEFVLATAKAGRAAGLTPLETAQECDLGEYADWLDSERLVGNLHRAYRDLEPSDGDLDVIGALGDMISFNGGQPLSCYA